MTPASFCVFCKDWIQRRRRSYWQREEAEMYHVHYVYGHSWKTTDRFSASRYQAAAWRARHPGRWLHECLKSRIYPISVGTGDPEMFLKEDPFTQNGDPPPVFVAFRWMKSPESSYKKSWKTSNWNASVWLSQTLFLLIAQQPERGEESPILVCRLKSLVCYSPVCKTSFSSLSESLRRQLRDREREEGGREEKTEKECFNQSEARYSIFPLTLLGLLPSRTNTHTPSHTHNLLKIKRNQEKGRDSDWEDDQSEIKEAEERRMNRMQSGSRWRREESAQAEERWNALQDRTESSLTTASSKNSRLMSGQLFWGKHTSRCTSTHGSGRGRDQRGDLQMRVCVERNHKV